MKVVDKELYLGAALAQIIECTGFTSIQKASATLGHYEVNAARRLLVRYTKSERGPWYFTFRPRDVRLMQKEMSNGAPFFLGLVCGNTATCLLTADQLTQVLDLAVADTQSIRVHTRHGASLTVSGSGGALDGKVTHHAFPSALFR